MMGYIYQFLIFYYVQFLVNNIFIVNIILTFLSVIPILSIETVFFLNLFSLWATNYHRLVWFVRYCFCLQVVD